MFQTKGCLPYVVASDSSGQAALELDDATEVIAANELHDQEEKLADILRIVNCDDVRVT
jgi:hypothetical protein